jgi:hypothetical protein
MVISIFENGDVNVDNFPIDLTEARKALWRAETAIISHAIKQVEEGRDAFNESSRIIRPVGPLGGMRN